LSSAIRQFAAVLATNVGIVVVGQILLTYLRGQALEHTLVFVLLVTLIVTLYDRYRPIHLARFAP
jgi:sensor histidine kinase regulating citrate/malate metabolism